MKKIFTFTVFAVLFVLCASSSISAATFTVTKIADPDDGTCDSDCSLREAVEQASRASDVAIFRPSDGSWWYARSSD